MGIVSMARIEQVEVATTCRKFSISDLGIVNCEEIRIRLLSGRTPTMTECEGVTRRKARGVGRALRSIVLFGFVLVSGSHFWVSDVEFYQICCAIAKRCFQDFLGGYEMTKQPGSVSIVTSIEFLVPTSKHPPTRIRITNIAARWIRQDMNRKILDKPFPFLTGVSCHKRNYKSGSQRIPRLSRCQRFIEDDEC
jgi:hypothetical protein